MYESTMLRPFRVPQIGCSEPFLMAFQLYRHRETPGEIQKAVDFLSRLYFFNYVIIFDPYIVGKN